MRLDLPIRAANRRKSGDEATRVVREMICGMIWCWLVLLGQSLHR
jgi:hypothetical protein